MRISDWSSDVCSSDLNPGTVNRGDIARVVEPDRQYAVIPDARTHERLPPGDAADIVPGRLAILTDERRAPQRPFDRALVVRSEERRVGKECVRTCRFCGSAYH